jgi:hypothetical protein
VAFALRPLAEVRFEKFDLILAILTFASLILGFLMGLLAFLPRQFKRMDVSFLVEDDFLNNPPAEAMISVADAHMKLVATNEAVIDRKFVVLQVGIVSVLIGLLLVALQAVLFLVLKIGR